MTSKIHKIVHVGNVELREREREREREGERGGERERERERESLCFCSNKVHIARNMKVMELIVHT